MSLKEISRVDKSAWIQSIQAASLLGDNDSFAEAAKFSTIVVYEHWRDQVWASVESAVDDWLRFDPLMTILGYTGGTNRHYQTSFSGALALGEYDPDLSIQRFYGYTNGGNHLIEHVDDSVPWQLASPSWSTDNWRAAGVFHLLSTGGAVEGARTVGAGGLVVFENAEPGTWPAGYALQADVSVQEGGSVYQHVLCQIDLADEGGSTGPPGGNGKAQIIPTANWYTATPSPQHPTAHAAPLAGFDVAFDTLQFVPDDDSTIAAPKGRLFLFNKNIGFPGNNQHRDGSVGPSTGTVMNKFVKVIDWNPTAKDATPGNVSRIHLRERLLSRCRFVEEQTIALGGIGISAGVTVGYLEHHGFYHPPSDTIRFRFNAASGANDGLTSEMVFSMQPALASLSTPTNHGEAETAKTITFEVIAAGDLGERISALDIGWALDRRSTEGEELAASTPGGTVFVDHFPIDGVSATDSSLVVYEDGSPLTVTTHYTVVLATGAITGVGAVFDSAKTYTVDYEHQQTGAQPPNGILRTTLSTTDENGKAIARVEAPDDLTIVGELDAIEASEA